MKRIIILTLAILAMASCKKTMDIKPELPDMNAPITLTASMEAGDAQVTKADYAFENGDDVFRLTAYSESVPTSNYNNTYFNNVIVKSTSGTLSLEPLQYYPASGAALYFYAYAPAPTTLTDGAAATAPIANYTITGREDIMAAKVETGIAKSVTSQQQPAFTGANKFEHKLQQISFQVKRDASYDAETSAVSVKSIEIIGANNNAQLDVVSGDLSFGAGTANFSANVDAVAGVAIPISSASAVTAGEPIMMEAGVTALTIKVTTMDGITFENSTATVGGLAGTSYVVTLTFKRNSITPTASITGWITGAGANSNII